MSAQHVSATCYYPMTAGNRRRVVTASRELRDGPLLTKLGDLARAAIAKATGSAA